MVKLWFCYTSLRLKLRNLSMLLIEHLLHYPYYSQNDLIHNYYLNTQGILPWPVRPSWLESCSVHQRMVSLIPSQATCRGCRYNPFSGACIGGNHLVFCSFSLPLPKIILKSCTKHLVSPHCPQASSAWHLNT